jgi:hypothetical protein
VKTSFAQKMWKRVWILQRYRKNILNSVLTKIIKEKNIGTSIDCVEKTQKFVYKKSQKVVYNILYKILHKFVYKTHKTSVVLIKIVNFASEN